MWTGVLIAFNLKSFPFETNRPIILKLLRSLQTKYWESIAVASVNFFILVAEEVW